MCRLMQYSRKEASTTCSKTLYLFSPVRFRQLSLSLSHRPVLWPIISLSPSPNTNGQSCCSRGPCRRPYKRLLYEIWICKASSTRADGNILRYNIRRAVHWQRVCVYSTTNITKSEERCIFLSRSQTLTFAQFMNRGLQQAARRFILYGPLCERIPVTERSLTQRRSFFFHLKSFRHGQEGSKNFANPTGWRTTQRYKELTMQ